MRFPQLNHSSLLSVSTPLSHRSSFRAIHQQISSKRMPSCETPPTALGTGPVRIVIRGAAQCATSCGGDSMIRSIGIPIDFGGRNNDVTVHANVDHALDKR